MKKITSINGLVNVMNQSLKSLFSEIFKFLHVLTTLVTVIRKVQPCRFKIDGVVIFCCCS